MCKNLFLACCVVLLTACFNDDSKQLNALYSDGNEQAELLLEGAEHIEFLYKQQRGGVQVSSIGRIAKILENQQTPYAAQVVLIRLSSGRKLLIKHNIEQASVVPDLTVGEMLSFKGLYSWNSQGGMILSTHQTPDTPQRSGWLKYQDITYQ